MFPNLTAPVWVRPGTLISIGHFIISVSQLMYFMNFDASLENMPLNSGICCSTENFSHLNIWIVSG